MRLIDTHCHIDLYPDYKVLIQEIEQAGIYTIAVTNTPSVFQTCVNLTQGARFIRVALGLHPELAVERQSELRLVEKLLTVTRYVGEIGLDYVTQDVEVRKVQQKVFQHFLEQAAIFRNKILTVHSRRAASDVLSMVGSNYPGTIILHWFSGSIKSVHQALAQGCYFSINTAMVSSGVGQRLLKEIPLERTLTETDGPFIQKGARAVRPKDISDVVVTLSKIWQLSPTETAQRIAENFKEVITKNSE